jgi:hypothetical protein
MTKNSGFKRLVRTRMAKTGESYSAALAILRGSNKTSCVCGRADCFTDRQFVCKECSEAYCRYPDVNEDYYRHPTDYSRSGAEYCLGCWLGVGPVSMAQMEASMAQMKAED